MSPSHDVLASSSRHTALERLPLLVRANRLARLHECDALNSKMELSIRPPFLRNRKGSRHRPRPPSESKAQSGAVHPRNPRQIASPRVAAVSASTSAKHGTYSVPSPSFPRFDLPWGFVAWLLCSTQHEPRCMEALAQGL